MIPDKHWASVEAAATVATPSPSPVALEKSAAPTAGATSTAPAATAATATAAASAAQDAGVPDSFESLRRIAQQIESYLQRNGRTLDFRVDESTGRAVITVRDTHTGEVIRQIPDEEALRIARTLGQNANALIDITA